MKTTIQRLALATLTLLGLSACSVSQPEGEIQGLAGLAISLDRTLGGMDRYELEIDRFKIPYLKGGEGEPLVLIHGFGGSKDNFNRVARYLTEHYTVYSIDLPGFGAATRIMGADYTIGAQADRVHEIITKLGLEKPHLGGNSMGGWISGAYAAKYPDEVASVWFLAPSGLTESLKSEVLKHYYETGEPLLIANSREQYERIIDLVMYERPALAPGFVIEAMAERAAQDVPLHAEIYSAFKDVDPNLDSTLKASEFDGPALIVWGQQDRVLHVDGAQQLQAALPGSEMQILDKTGHVPMLERPETVAKRYIEWRKKK
ncbi:MAG: alpha/beta hydrolase [Limnobacter sp.]|nr:alpha/beta hydrolase [Limnobacter sp.]